MEELKFRYWSESEKKYTSTDEMPIVGENSELLELEGWDNDVFEQFIGIKDKNGKDIYVGAVIEYTQHKAYNLGGFKARVVFDDENACFGFIKENPLFEGFINSFAEIDELQTDFLDYCEVIGNINKNPELLKK